MNCFESNKCLNDKGKLYFMMAHKDDLTFEKDFLNNIPYLMVENRGHHLANTKIRVCKYGDSEYIKFP